MTPETHDTAHYYYLVARNCDLDNEAFDDGFKQVVSLAFEEDVFATREMQRLLNEDGHQFADINIAADKSGLQVRRVIVEMVNREYGTNKQH